MGLWHEPALGCTVLVSCAVSQRLHIFWCIFCFTSVNWHQNRAEFGRCVVQHVIMLIIYMQFRWILWEVGEYVDLSENARTEVLPVVCWRMELSGMLHCVIGWVVASYCLEKLMTSHLLSHCKFSGELCPKQWCCEKLKSCIVWECSFLWRRYLSGSAVWFIGRPRLDCRL